MKRRSLLLAPALAAALFSTTSIGFADSMEDKSKATLETVKAFMGAMGGGDMKTMSNLMAEDMVWQNEGDPSLPWIGTWKGKETIFGFLGTFSKNVKVTHWENQDLFASGDTAAVFGEMKLQTTTSGKETEKFTFALRAKVKDGKVVLWNWFEDTYAVSKAFHGK